MGYLYHQKFTILKYYPFNLILLQVYHFPKPIQPIIMESLNLLHYF